MPPVSGRGGAWVRQPNGVGLAETGRRRPSSGFSPLKRWPDQAPQAGVVRGTSDPIEPRDSVGPASYPFSARIELG